MYHLRVTVALNLTSDLVFRIIMSGAYLFYNSSLVCERILGWQSVPFHFWVTVTLTSDLVFRIFYIL